MNLRTDYLKHLKAGTAIAFALLAMALLARYSLPLAIAIGGTGGCGFVEWYQRQRGNGEADPRDLAWGALPSWLLALAAWLAGL